MQTLICLTRARKGFSLAVTWIRILNNNIIYFNFQVLLTFWSNASYFSCLFLLLQALEQAQSEEKQRVLSMLSDTFADMEKEIQACRSLRRERVGVPPRHSVHMEGSRPLSSVFSFSTSTLDTIRHGEARSNTERRQSESGAEPNDPREMLEKYSDILVDLVKQKLTSNL